MLEILILVGEIWKFWQRGLEDLIIKSGSISGKEGTSYEDLMSWKLWRNQVGLLGGKYLLQTRRP